MAKVSTLKKPKSGSSRMSAASKAARPRTRKAAAPAPSRLRPIELLIGTVKGGFVLKGSDPGKGWSLTGPHFLGCEVNDLVLDPWDRQTLLMAAKTGHLGPTVFRSTDQGKSWREAKQPPAFPKEPGGKAVDRVFFVAPGHPSQPGVWWAGTVPHALFRSTDGGESWAPVQGFTEFVSALKEKTPDPLRRNSGRRHHAFPPDRSEGREPHVRLPFHGRVLRDAGRAVELEANERGSIALFLPGIAGVRPGSALGSPVPRQSGPSLPAEPLRCLPTGPAGREMGSDWKEPSQGDRRYRLSDRGPSPGSGYRLGFPDGWHGCLASDQSGRQARRVQKP